MDFERKEGDFNRIHRIRKIYVAIAIILLNTLVFILLMNLFFSIANPTLRKLFVFSESSFNKEILDEAYPHISSKEVRKEIIKENDKYHLPFVYDTFTGFRTKEHHGTFVNVDNEGFRYIKDQCEYPIRKSNYNIFILGGSTAFGSGIIDNETIASIMQENLRRELKRNDICVYNFARPHYYSSVERTLFIKLLVEKKQTPDTVIFIDGLNDHIGDKYPYEDKFADYAEGNKKIGYLFSGTASAIVINHLYNRFVKNNGLEDSYEKNASRIVERYLHNLKVSRSVGSSFNVTTHFVIQPIPVYNYPCESHLLCKRDLIDFSLPKWEKSIEYYTMLSSSKERKEGDIIWLADMQKGRKDNLYVDYGHYTAKFSEEIADELIKEIKGKIPIEPKTLRSDQYISRDVAFDNMS